MVHRILCDEVVAPSPDSIEVEIITILGCHFRVHGHETYDDFLNMLKFATQRAVQTMTRAQRKRWQRAGRPTDEASVAAILAK
jgi:glycerol-3-phosphate cytidylyltransferase-like family protein